MAASEPGEADGLVTRQDDDERFCWVVILRRRGKVYTYIRSVEGMRQVIMKFRSENGGSNPYRIWAIVDDEMKQVEIGD